MTGPRQNRLFRVGPRVGLGICLAIVTAAAPATSTIVGYPVDLKSCVREAGYVFAGTVSNMRAEKVPHTIVTRIAFSNVVYAKGKGEAGTIVLTMQGGEVDGMGIGIGCPSLPEFHVGERYIVLATSDLGSPANQYLPIVEFNQGVFLLQREKAGGPLVVGQHFPVIDYREGQLVYAANGNTGRRYTEKQFLDLIRKIAAEK